MVNNGAGYDKKNFFYSISVKSVKSVITDRLFKNRDTLLKSGACSNESAMFDEY